MDRGCFCLRIHTAFWINSFNRYTLKILSIFLNLVLSISFFFWKICPSWALFFLLFSCQYILCTVFIFFLVINYIPKIKFLYLFTGRNLYLYAVCLWLEEKGGAGASGHRSYCRSQTGTLPMLITHAYLNYCTVDQ